MTAYQDPFSPKGNVESDVPAAGETSTQNENGVPKGTTKEVLAWVGTDAERARLALEVEQQDNTPRKGLVRELSEITEKEATPVAEVEQHPQFGGADGQGGTGGSGYPEQFTANEANAQGDAGGQEATEKSNVPADQEADAGPGDADQGTAPDGTAGGNEATYGSAVPADQVASTEGETIETDVPESAKGYSDAPEGERAEDLGKDSSE